MERRGEEGRGGERRGEERRGEEGREEGPCDAAIADVICHFPSQGQCR